MREPDTPRDPQDARALGYLEGRRQGILACMAELDAKRLRHYPALSSYDPAYKELDRTYLTLFADASALLTEARHA